MVSKGLPGVQSNTNKGPLLAEAEYTIFIFTPLRPWPFLRARANTYTQRHVLLAEMSPGMITRKNATHTKTQLKCKPCLKKDKKRQEVHFDQSACIPFSIPPFSYFSHFPFTYVHIEGVSSSSSSLFLFSTPLPIPSASPSEKKALQRCIVVCYILWQRIGEYLIRVSNNGKCIWSLFTATTTININNI